MRVFAAVFRTLGLCLGVLVLAAFLLQAWYFSHVLWWNSHEPSSTSFMQERMERMRYADPRARLAHRWVPYERISTHLKRAVIASEDARFLTHNGFDWDAIQRAAQRNERRGAIVGGASTISQQLAKNLFLSGERSWLRKGQEAVITWMLEAVMSKRRILELYLNVAEWGDGIYGAEAAARYHFGVPARALSASQSAWLAVTLPSPRAYRGGRLTSYLGSRVNTILVRMRSTPIP